ncbi:multidrug transporter EmrE-like cation transporter [Oikeobacillus pervagus]|uniref:Multidrug transporter EmrE-like cation transporter n=1 Tax=Oikeobacillus pervagus TaxID=1325931 RepID=A0AAJ1WJB5_9BACI|nr:EamA family transporter [Oikeobacillus pervagus]MDQ0215263.1 multidrug transporter EmrE-like cation transporter [Oikeobacillus pervagus]
MIYLMLLMNILMLVSGQILWKMAVSGITDWNVSTIFSLVISPFFLGGAALYVLATGLWLVILSKLPLSVAYPSQSLSYILGAIFAVVLFKEIVTPTQWLGMIIIMVGVFLIAK